MDYSLCFSWWLDSDPHRRYREPCKVPYVGDGFFCVGAGDCVFFPKKPVSGKLANTQRVLRFEELVSTTLRWFGSEQNGSVTFGNPHLRCTPWQNHHTIWRTVGQSIGRHLPCVLLSCRGSNVAMIGLAGTQQRMCLNNCGNRTQ